MELTNTVDMMLSNDYKERFKAEYYQTVIRYEKLSNMLAKWDSGHLEFTPTCPRELYSAQVDGMSKYIHVLAQRAKLEGIELEVI